MGWSKLKLAVAVVLLASNLLLLISVISLYRSTEYLPEEYLARMSRMLEEEGILLGEEALQGKKMNPLIYEGTLDEDYYSRIAEKLSRSTAKLSFNTPNGNVMAMENGDRLVFQGGFGIQYMHANAENLTLNDYADKKLIELDSSEMRQLQRAVEDFLKRAEFSSGESLVLSLTMKLLTAGEDPETGIRYCVCAQTARGIQVLNFISTFAVDGSQVLGMSGEWCFSALDSSYSAQLLDQIHILYSVKDRILEEKEDPSSSVTIESLELGYSSYFRGDMDRFYLIPTWNIETVLGKIYRINALDGTEYTK